MALEEECGMRKAGGSKAMLVLLLGTAFGVGGCSSSPAATGDADGADEKIDGGETTSDAGTVTSDSALDATDAPPPDPNCMTAEGVTDLTGVLGGNALDAAFEVMVGREVLLVGTADLSMTAYHPLVGDVQLSFPAPDVGRRVLITLVTLTVSGVETTCSAQGCPAGMSVAIGQPASTVITTTSTSCGSPATVTLDSSAVLTLSVTNGAPSVGIHVQLLPAQDN